MIGDTPSSAPARGTVTCELIYARLDAAYGDERWHWMPDVVRGPIDVIAGAVLVQHTTWTNAERALECLRSAGALDTEVLATMPLDALAALVRVSGTPSIKARRLRALAAMVEDGGGLPWLLTLPLATMRMTLIATHGVGPETADAIALYAAGHRTFVIDAYTKRLARRIGIAPADDRYETWQRFFEDALPDADAALFQRYHAWIVLHGKTLCRATPRCAPCPLLDVCDYGRARVVAAPTRSASLARGATR